MVSCPSPSLVLQWNENTNFIKTPPKIKKIQIKMKHSRMTGLILVECLIAWILVGASSAFASITKKKKKKTKWKKKFPILISKHQKKTTSKR